MPEVQSPLRSDAAPLNGLIEAVLEAHGDAVAFMRDPTRSGLSGLCADLAKQSGRRVVLQEDAIAVRPAAEHAAEMLGLDPLEIANEGKVVLVVREHAVEGVLATMRSHPLGGESAVIGQVDAHDDGLCELCTALGGRRVIVKPYGEQLPRIC
jgi:hydrogenase expression/formation protein HypE